VDEIAKLEHGKMLKVWTRQAQCKRQIAQWKANLDLEVKGAVTALKQAGKDPFELLVRPGAISPHLPTPPHTSPHLPTSPHISPHLPTDLLEGYLRLIDSVPAETAEKVRVPCGAASECLRCLGAASE
jgi:TusA-related sulfurtransferase